MKRKLCIRTQIYPVAGEFKISRSTLTEIHVVVVEIHEGQYVGRGECRPYKRYNQTTDSVISEIQSIKYKIEHGLSRQALQDTLASGAARNALDCALWDLEAKISNKPVWELLNLAPPTKRETAYTLSINTPDIMAQHARQAVNHSILKIKIGDVSGLQSCLAILEARPDAKLIIDANEALNSKDISTFQETLRDRSVIFMEQPLPANDTSYFDPAKKPIICADEALHSATDLPSLWEKGYRAVNVKLDKCGGLTAGHYLMNAAKDMGFMTMAGCMVGSSLAMAPMMILESLADVIDLDGPLLLKKDISNGLKYQDGNVYPPIRKLWG